MIEDFAQALAEDFNAGRVPAVPVLVGEWHVDQQEAPPRVIVVPMGDTFGAQEKVPGSPRPVLSVIREIAVWLFARDLTQLEEFINTTVAGLRRLATVQAMLGAGEFMSALDPSADGCAYRLTVRVKGSITSQPETSATITQTAPTVELDPVEDPEA